MGFEKEVFFKLKRLNCKRDKPLHDMVHSRGIYSIDLENDKLVSCTLDGHLTMWNIQTGESIQQFVSPRLLTDLLGITQRRTMTIEGNRSCTVKFNGDKVLCNNDLSSSVVYWNAKYSMPIASFKTANKTAHVTSFEMDRRKIVASIQSTSKSYLHVWHFNPKREKRQ
jgi:WD40 repeat protein